MITLYEENTDKLSVKAASIILNELEELAKEKERIVLGLPGGRSVKKVYEEFGKGNSDAWKKTHIFTIDERVAPIGSDDRNSKLIQESFADELLKKGLLEKNRLHFLKGMEEKNFLEYYDELDKLGGFDIVLLGVGEDGHVAALYPGHPVLDKEGSYAYMEDSPKPPPKRVTATKNLITSAGLVCLFFIGEGKKEAYKAFLDDSKDFRENPAKIGLEAKKLFVFTNIKK
jgi:6-phosphogluconolactonase